MPTPQESYTHVVELMVRAGEPHLAVRLAAEAHESGALACYSLPNLGGGAPQPGTALGNVIDLRQATGSGVGGGGSSRAGSRHRGRAWRRQALL